MFGFKRVRNWELPFPVPPRKGVNINPAPDYPKPPAPPPPPARLNVASFDEWFRSQPYRAKYDCDSPVYLAAREAWNAARETA